MRPVRLRLRGFTAFREEQEIDFSRLDLFAIAGPTGAGKSSLLDAITYALFGCVERVGNQVAQLISQGLPAMAVDVEFEVGGERWRITRRTQRSTGKQPSATKVVVERQVDGEWVPDASGVREVEERVRALIGLDYEGFTRAVLLPQGKFDQFLSGEPRERRRILSDLLDLHLYERMQKHALSIAKTARDEQGFIHGQLETDYAGADEAALGEERSKARTLREREQAVLEARATVRKLLGRRDESRREADELRRCAVEARELGRDATSASRAFSDLKRQIADADGAAADATRTATEATNIATRARENHAKAVEEWGGIKQLVELQTKARHLADSRSRSDELASELAEAKQRESALRRAIADADRALASARSVEAEAKRAVDAAREELERAQHDEALAVVARDLKKGDPCPVCRKPLLTAPRIAGATSLDRAKAALARAEATDAKAQERRRVAEDRRKDATRELDALGERMSEARAAAKSEKERAAASERALRDVFGARPPADPVKALGERIDELERLAAAATRAEREAATLREASSRAEHSRSALAAKVETERVRLPIGAARALERRATELARPAMLPRFAAQLPLHADAAGLAAFALELAAALARSAETIERVVAERSASDEALLAEAAAAVGAIVPTGRTLDALAETLDADARMTAGEASTVEERAKRLEDLLQRKSELVQRAAALGARADVYQALSRDLQANAIVEFVQAEALHALATEGTKRLAHLSGNRYRLRYRDDEFFVVDTSNGDEERSVRTLSGGETFLASLALALTLSEQIRALSTTERARLDSLFLDEGFGTLDRETLTTVVAGIDQLGVDGRLVGVISHVRELTDQFPRIEVEKSPRGSRAKLVVT